MNVLNELNSPFFESLFFKISPTEVLIRLTHWDLDG